MTNLVRKPIQAANSYKYVKYKETKDNTVIALGEYLGHDMVKNMNPEKPDVPRFKILQEDGTTVVLNSATNLNPLLLPLSVGSQVEIIFKGFKKAKSKAGMPFTIGMFEVSELVEG